MFTINVRKLFRKAFGFRAQTLSHSKPRSGFRPRLEALEDRIVPASFLVTNLNDAGAGSLRGAIQGVNGSPDDNNTINFARGVKPLSGDIVLQSDLDPIKKNVDLEGPGGGLITVDGNYLYSIFQVNQNVIASINGLTITNGNAPTGGGVLNSGSLTLINDEIANNKATGNGGGISNGDPAAHLYLSDDLIQTNSAGVSGGGISNFGYVDSCNSDDTEIIGNTAKNEGGGIYNDGAIDLTGDVIQTNAVNSSSGLGGGVYNAGIGVSFTFTGTIANNTAYQGGGIYNLGIVVLNDTTVGPSNRANQGGGLYLGTNSSTTFNTVTVKGNQLIGDNGDAAGIGYIKGATIINNGLTDGDDPGGNPVQL